MICKISVRKDTAKLLFGNVIWTTYGTDSESEVAGC